MQNAIKVEIKRLAKRAFEKKERSEKLEEQYQGRFTKRTGLVAGPSSRKPAAPISRHFDPKYCSRNANFLAKTIWHKVLTEEYEPVPAVCYKIPKPDGLLFLRCPPDGLARCPLSQGDERGSLV